MRFHFMGSFEPDASSKPAYVGGFFTAPEKPTRQQLTEMFAEDAKQQRAARNEPARDPGLVSVIRLFELPAVPHAPDAGEATPHWLLEVNMVCHDVKFGCSAEAVFVWPEEPRGTVLEQMTQVLVADMLALRGSEPDYAEVTEVVSRKVSRTAAPVTGRYE